MPSLYKTPEKMNNRGFVKRRIEVSKGFIWLGRFQAYNQESFMELREMIGKDLAGYSVEELYEVFKVDDDGKKVKSVGYFRKEEIANAFAGNQVDASWHKVRKAFVLTDGNTNGFLLSGEPVTLLNDEEAALAIRTAAMAKLSLAERKVLGY